MDFFAPGKIFELQRWTEDETLNGKIVGIVESNKIKKSYQIYIFETKGLIQVTSAQLTYPNIDSNHKQKLQNLLNTVIEQKKQHQINLAIKSEEDEKEKLLLEKQKKEQEKLKSVLPQIVFNTNDIEGNNPFSTNNNDDNDDDDDDDIKTTQHQTNETMIVIDEPPNDLYTDKNSEKITVQESESNVPKGYALVPVSTLNEVVNIKNQEKQLKEKQIELQKQNESMKQKEIEIINQQKEQIKQQTEQIQQIQQIQQQQQQQ
eukprot:76615_1